MKTVKILIPATLIPTAVSLAGLWKGNIADSVAGLDEWLGQKTEEEVVVTDMAVLGLFRLAHANGRVNVLSIGFTMPNGTSQEVTVAHDGRLSLWYTSVLDIGGDVTSELLSLRKHQSKNGG